MKTGRKYIVVGGRGYVGSALFSSIPDGIVGLRTTSTMTEGFLSLRLEEPQDHSDLPIVDGDVLFLTAAISAPDICAREQDLAFAANVTGTSALIDSVIARGARVVFFSSDTVYGERAEEFDEHAVCNPAGEYAAMKREIETRFAGNPSFKSIRLSYVFSREDKFTRYLVSCVELGEEADLFHPFFRAVIHRDDVVKAALALAACWDEVPAQFINFGGPQVLSRIDFAECLREVTFPDLRFKIVRPEMDFFRNRPRIIAMTSPLLGRLLGRQPHSLRESASLEFSALV